MLAPLAERLRPDTLDEVVGQRQLLGEDGLIRHLVQQQRPVSILLWGPPGCGKTTIARAYARAFNAHFVQLSAVFSGVADIKKVVKDAESQPLLNPYTVLFVDEIHRFNKAQQDAFLPYMERGSIVLVGATTENPSFALNDALLSRLRVLTLESLGSDDLHALLKRCEERSGDLPLTQEGRQHLIQMAQGDARHLFNLVENLQGLDVQDPLGPEGLEPLLQKRPARFDRAGEGHYNLISALHKAVRGSDPQAALYWLCRILEGGEDPLFVMRRVIRMASEDIGLADPFALQHCLAARDSYQMLGSPEGELAIAQAVVYLALAPKSNALYKAYGECRKLAKETSQLNPPSIILNAPTKLMKELGYGKGYQYDHDCPHAFSGQNYFPDGMERPEFYQPVERGFEREMRKRMDYFQTLRSGSGE